jgi:hypothetical protein
MNYTYEDCEKENIKNNHNELLNYINFDLNHNDFFKKLLWWCKDENVLKHVIDNVVDLECENIDK